MKFQPQIHSISVDSINRVADNLIQIAEKSKNKNLLRNEILANRLRKARISSNILTNRQITSIISQLDKTSSSSICYWSRRVSKLLAKHYAQLCKMSKELNNK